ncbi:RagB/SusD family nutrient uptake outer membrane protein [uncultured Draconibacterium sp.]|uniref:RagB/SusD family nutrient uptake outer membrane protein n=1 Tax=uncultured Draconibacterium sp. TaxID=1573823 RepID=UPI002AA691D8|nr:RagB/SusD family nutrient uptake outer membrane protein [uncultured Draconibacterium sp.]
MEKIGRYISKLLLLIIVFVQTISCTDLLDVELYSELNPKSNSEDIIMATLYNAYSNAQLPFWNGGLTRYYTSAMTSGESWNESGGVAARFNPLRSFTWASNHSDLGASWNTCYQGIRDANTLLENVGDETDFQKLVRAESFFIRGWSYVVLYDLFGAVPLRTSTLDEPNLAKASDAEILTQVEKDLLEAIKFLPDDPLEHGRASKGAAMGILCKFYLNTKQWQKVVEMSQSIISLEKYELLPNYKDVFAIDNENNKELLWVLARTASGASGNDGGGTYLQALSFPPDYPLASNQSVYAAKTYFYDEFLDSFEEGDERSELFVRDYTNTSGNHIQLYGNDKSLTLKYDFDPEAVGPANGNDMPEVRYSDILLSRAEALNELNGPTQEAVDLINEVRARAGVSLKSLSDFPSKEVMRSAILQEREWEFYAEAKGRQDQIRQGVFISRALERGIITAQAYHVLFAIPLSEVNANPNIEQNTGY